MEKISYVSLIFSSYSHLFYKLAANRYKALFVCKQMAVYYFDTCIWRDHYEARYGFGGRPIGSDASKFFIKIIKDKDTLLYSDLIIRELKSDYADSVINEMFNILFCTGVLKKINITKKDYGKAKNISFSRSIPVGDILHALLASENNAILISQDNHFQKLKDIVAKPEEIV